MICRIGERPYVGDRFILDRTGYHVVYGDDASAVVPFACQRCDAVLRTEDDEDAARKFDGLCVACAYDPDRRVGDADEARARRAQNPPLVSTVLTLT